MPSDSSTATLWCDSTRKPSQPMIHAASPAIGAATRTESEQRERQHEHEGERAAGDRAERARDELGRRLRLDPPLDRSERPVEEPAEESAGHVAEQAAEHPAQPVGRRAEAAGGPEARRGAQHHDEQAYSLDEHGSLVDTVGPGRQSGRASRSLSIGPVLGRDLIGHSTSGRERIVPMRR